MNQPIQRRRESALGRLKDTLARGLKNGGGEGFVPLTEQDTARIEGEIATLTKRLGRNA